MKKGLSPHLKGVLESDLLTFGAIYRIFVTKMRKRKAWAALFLAAVTAAAMAGCSDTADTDTQDANGENMSTETGEETAEGKAEEISMS